MVNHFKKIKAEGKVNSKDRTVATFSQIHCDESFHVSDLAKSGNVFRLTDLNAEAVDSIVMETYLQENDSTKNKQAN